MSAPGKPLPPFATTAAVSGRAVGPETLRGHRAVIVCHGVKSTDAAKSVARAVRTKHPEAKDPILVTVVDLRGMGGLWRKVAEAQIKSTYERLAVKVPAGQDPADHILICPDWDGSTVTALGFATADADPGALIVGADGTVQRVERGLMDLGDKVVAALG